MVSWWSSTLCIQCKSFTDTYLGRLRCIARIDLYARSLANVICNCRIFIPESCAGLSNYITPESFIRVLFITVPIANHEVIVRHIPVRELSP